ncbi:hypothetical protein [Acanthopleuribacter pedis]|uniref:PilZ domain-containing protein n=1 Tax=Acanthopleuribacter pedis TaxID=442870 RepID=A0A8J7QBY6_9BACT|nr:hypothetical protein [Acanthopleuribacter pedis]MBO1318176.1 hypothetical protein [Acanthopleuribacter pedis]
MSQHSLPGPETPVTVFLACFKRALVPDISPVGMGLQTPHTLAVGKNYLFQIHCQGHTFSVMGGVVRWSLSELRPDDTGSSVPLYSGGIEFDIPRSYTEQNLWHLLKENSPGEKRIGSPRIEPLYQVFADVFEAVDSEVGFLANGDLVFSAPRPFDPDGEWDLILAWGERHVEIVGRVVQVSKKDNQSAYLSVLEVMKCEPKGEELLNRMRASFPRS